MSKRHIALPDGWSWATLENVATKVGTGATPKGGSKAYKLSGIPLIRSMNIHFDGFKREGLALLDDEQAEALNNATVKANDVLLNITGASIGRVSQVPIDLAGARVNQHVCIIRLAEPLDHAFLRYYLSSPSVQEAILGAEYGVTRQALTKGQVLAFKIPWPPLAEQRRIVAKIEALKERSQQAREALADVEPLLEQFRQSVLTAAFRGDLTTDWRAAHSHIEPASELLHRIRTERRRRWEQAELDKYETKGQKPPKNWQDKYEEPEPMDDSDLPELPDGWCWASIDIISEVVRGASPRPAGDPRYFDGDHTPWITVGEITKDDEIYLTNTATYLTEAGRVASRFIPSEILLLTNSGATLGVPKITKIGGCINDGSVAIISVSGQFQLYLYFYLLSLTESFRRINQGAAQPNLNTGIVRQITVPVAPAAEQEEIIKSLNIALATYRSLKREIPELSGQMDQLDQSILAKAFRGELVPQDPNDEPASALLSRIREQRMQQAEPAKHKQKTATTQRGNQRCEESSRPTPQQLTLTEMLLTKD
jgi:type I restriction enzyme S subunit